MFLKFMAYLRSGENFYGNLDSDAVLSYLADFSAPAHLAAQYSNLGYALLRDLARKDRRVLNTVACNFAAQQSAPPEVCCGAKFDAQSAAREPSARGACQ